ncbi:Metal dependent phosphohydrolase [Petrocella atlantisensis]|uniref:Metal dependent phosphohydrolase n=1 Tax=Petrocella atlantisensis TaxID=2173034 RepID=A0A3P7RV53_9FIRM|nr:HD domain-containing protein [Petrocella atlantisensis]VDN46666.1 Metal dependent phosphohydrolase [Petrocella atlantisensis]
MDINAAKEFIIKKHKGQIRLGGEAYSSHPIAVAELMRSKALSEETIITALFHDLLEDTDATEEEILDLSNQKVLKAVKLLTKYDGYVMNEYIDNIKMNKTALCVKLADRIHNLRCAIIANEQFKQKYIAETEKYYIPIGEGTIFEQDLLESLVELKKSL